MTFEDDMARVFVYVNMIVDELSAHLMWHSMLVDVTLIGLVSSVQG